MAPCDSDYFDPFSASSPSSSTPTTTTTLSEQPQSPLAGTDWTADIPDSDHVRFFREHDWAATPLGALQTWGPALRIHVYTTFADSRPACLYWGPDKLAIYNEAFVPLAGAAHPALMGNAFHVIFAVIWDDIRPVFELAQSSAKAVDVLELPLMVERNGFLEESIFTGNFNPVRGDSGRIEGFYNAVFEITRQKLWERRTAMLNMISSPPEQHTTSTIGEHILKCLETNDKDIPMAILLQADEESVPGKCLIRRAGYIGVPVGHVLMCEEMELNESKGLMPLLRKADKKPLTVETPEDFAGVEWRGFGEPSKHISIVPCWNGGRLYGYLVLGTNPRRAIDADHEQLLADIGRQLSSTIASVVGHEQATKRQERLERELADSEKQITYLAQHAQVAMQHMRLDGSAIWANDHYYTMTRYPDQHNGPNQQLDIIHPDDLQRSQEAWESLLAGNIKADFEVRLKRLFVPPVGKPEPATMLCFAFPYEKDGKVQSIMSCMTDVSSLKWAEKWQARSAEEAREAKRQQEEFIDAISHEVRNPLSAIFQLADSINGSFAELETKDLILDKALATLKENVEAAKTILLCANHQKRIVDDVLTLSKLDFMLLSLSPTPIRVPELVSDALRMFDADSRIYNINLTTIEDEEYAQHNVDWVLCDPSRVTQIFINLLTNAIKFTKGGERRDIHIKYGVSVTEPWKAFPDEMYWAPKQKEATDDITLRPEWGTGEHLYLNFSISDTGTGIDDAELKKLFSRFQQASSKTFVKYGGSGLGLFISQRLAEKQGGDIGVMSTPGRGSTFAFYIKARRGIAPASAQRLEIDRSQSIITESHSRALKDISSLSLVELEPAAPRALHVLLVEDNLVNQQIVRRQLTKAKCVVYVANHGLEALDVLRRTCHWHDPSNPTENVPLPLDIILMDWEMPIMNGLECSREIRRLEREGVVNRHVEIIAITANTRREQIDTALKAGIDDVVSKPFVVGDLLAKMRQRLAM